MVLQWFREGDYDYRADLSLDDYQSGAPFGPDPSIDPRNTNFSDASRQVLWHLKNGHGAYYKSKFSVASDAYSKARSFLIAYLDTNPIRVHTEDQRLWLREYRSMIIPMSRGDALRQAGGNLDAAEAYSETGAYSSAAPPISWPACWARIAESVIAAADEEFRRENQNYAAELYRLVLPEGAPSQDNIVYADRLRPMLERALEIKRAIEGGTSPARVDEYSETPLMTAHVATCMSRLSQIAAGENYFGFNSNSIPLLRFDTLYDLSRNFCQQAIRASRDYVSFQSNAENETYSINSLKRAINTETAALQVELSGVDSSRQDLVAAEKAVATAITRHDLARESYRRYQSVGSELADLEELSAWANSAQGTQRQAKLRIQGWEHLGLEGGYVDADYRIQELARERARRSYQLRLSELRNAIETRFAEVTEARARRNSAAARVETANRRVAASAARVHAAEANLEAMQSQTIGPRLYYELSGQARLAAAVMLERAIQVAYLMQYAYEAEFGTTVRRIRLNYGEMPVAEGLMAADLLLADIEYFAYHRAVIEKGKLQPAVKRIVMSRDFPLELAMIRTTGSAEFSTTLTMFHAQMLGMYNGRVKNVAVKFVGSLSNEAVNGTLSCGSISAVRLLDSSHEGRIELRHHASETLLLSSYRAQDYSFMTAAPREQLGVFENIGLETSWLLSVPLRSNDFDRNALTDIEILIAYACQHDSLLEEADRNKLPTSGVAVTFFSLAMDFPDALYDLQTTGSAQFTIGNELLRRNHKQIRVKQFALNVRSSVSVADANLHPIIFEVSSDGHLQVVDVAIDRSTMLGRAERPDGLSPLEGVPVVGKWNLTLEPLIGLERPERWFDDVLVIFEYEFDYA